MAQHPAPDHDDACYLALKARDARFDGCFFTGVTSTGIYCRPVCRVRTPKRENCRFFAHAALAEQAGFRPCLRCRPELAPRSQAMAPGGETAVWSVQDASRMLAWQAARWLDAPQAWGLQAPSISALAQRLGVSARHLRRIFGLHWGVTPLQYLQTRRLLCAKQLLCDTVLPVAQIAADSGFASVRRFNAAFVQHYRLQPSALRAQAVPAGTHAAQLPGLRLRLAYRPPYDVSAMLDFFARRAIAGHEQVLGVARAQPATGADSGLAGQARVLRSTLRLEHGGRVHTGWVSAEFDTARCQVQLRLSDSLSGVLPAVLHRLRHWLDLDADPRAIHAVLHTSFAQGEGLRVPGTLDGFELAVRAVLGQQVTVAAARTLATRLVQRFGEPLATPFAGLERLFPSPATLAQANPDELGRLGIVRQRQGAIQALARAVLAQRLDLHAGADIAATTAQLQTLPGIGAWTAQYIAMRALRDSDAFAAGDVALHKALGLGAQRQAAAAALAASRAWQPWRSYAMVRAWARQGTPDQHRGTSDLLRNQ